MRKMFVSACLFAAMAFTACTTEVIYVDSDGNPVEHVDLKEGEGLLSVAVSSTDVSTRDVRPVGSSAAANNVNVVKVYAFSATTDAGPYTFDEAIGVKAGANTNVSGGQGVITVDVTETVNEVVNPENGVNIEEEEIITLTGIDKTKYYKFVAVGYNNVGDYTLSSISNGTTLGDFTATISEAAKSNCYQIAELFATESATAKKGDAKDFGTLTLTRQVAGMLAYFKNVPAKIGGKEVYFVKVFANAKTESFTFPAAASDLNGTSQTNAKTEIMTFKVHELKTSVDANGFYTFDTMDGTSTPTTKPLADGYEAIAPENLALEQNSIFGARFLIPYETHLDGSSSSTIPTTLIIELQGSDGAVLRTLKVKTNQTSLPSGASAEYYDIRCNNFYSIGQKYKTDTTDPDPDGGTDPDEPIDLSGNSEVLVQINDAWSVLHDMTVEE